MLSNPLKPLIAIVVVPEDFDAITPVAALDPLLRHILALQAASVEEIWLLGAKITPPEDPRIQIPIHCSKVLPRRRAILVPADLTYHRLLPHRLACLDIDDQDAYRIGQSKAILIAGASRVHQLVQAMVEGRYGEDLPEQPLAPTEFLLDVANKKQRQEAVWFHLRSLVKPTSGYWERLYMRPLSIYMTRALLGTPVTPNQMSIVTLFIALLSAYLVALPGYIFCLAGGFLHIFMRVVDCVDGELARLRYQTSRFGEWLDSVGDGIGLAAFVAGVTVQVMREAPGFLWVGAIGVIAWGIVQGLQYYAAIRSGGVGTFQLIEWGHRAKEKTAIERLVAKLELAFRIDAISTLYGILAIFNLLPVLLVVHMVSAIGGSLYFSTQVTKIRS